MKSINRKDFITVGRVLKIHGTKGEVKLDLQSNIDLKEWAFLEIQGKPVPFYIQEMMGSEEEPIVKFANVDSPQQAQKIAGLNVLILGKVGKAEKGWSSVMGYKIMDETIGEIGIVTDLMEMPQQLLIQTTYKGKEVLIPAVDDIILEINDKKKWIIVNIPEGLLDI